MFHVRDGLFFQRLDESGRVRVVKHETANVNSPVVFEIVLSEFQWMSVVDAVAYDPGAAYPHVNELHRGIGSGV